MSRMSILERWKISEQEITTIIDENPSLRGFLLGYIGEYKLRSIFLGSPEVQSLTKPDDHDRRKGKKNDMTINYRGFDFTVEVKSLQTHSIRQFSDGTMIGRVQVDASDRRFVSLPNGEKVETTCLLAGEFDVLAVNLFQFREEWNFAFALNRDLPKTQHKKYTVEQRNYLLASTVAVTWPTTLPFVINPFELFDILIAEREV